MTSDQRERVARAIAEAEGDQPWMEPKPRHYRMADAALAALDAPQPSVEEAARVPDYCYDPMDWEFTQPWAERADMFDGFPLWEITEIATLYKGPRMWTVEVALDTSGSGEADDYERRWFTSEDEAKAFVAECKADALAQGEAQAPNAKEDG